MRAFDFETICSICRYCTTKSNVTSKQCCYSGSNLLRKCYQQTCIVWKLGTLVKLPCKKSTKFEVQGFYRHGWERVATEDNIKAAQNRLKHYCKINSKIEFRIVSDKSKFLAIDRDVEHRLDAHFARKSFKSRKILTRSK
jgi:hypothetical protein